MAQAGGATMRCAHAVALVSLLLGLASSAHAGRLEDFMARVNVQARADLGAFTARISGQFGVPEANVRVVLSAVSDPADAFMVFQVGDFCHRSPDDVLAVYRAYSHKGWGAMAKSLGIKPGSPEFHALKDGNLRFAGLGDDVPASPAPSSGHGRGKAKGRGKP
jgi:hypothetical protein